MADLALQGALAVVTNPRAVLSQSVPVIGQASKVKDIYDYSKGHYKAKLDNEYVSLSICADGGKADFKFNIDGRTDLKKLKKVIDFALKIKWLILH